MAAAIFISYASEDQAKARELCTLLASLGVSYWMAPDSIEPGVPYGPAISEAIEQCNLFVLLFSEYADRSEDVHREVQIASEEKKHIVPLRLSTEFNPRRLRYHLSALQWIEWQESAGPDRLRQLLKKRGFVGDQPPLRPLSRSTAPSQLTAISRVPASPASLVPKPAEVLLRAKAFGLEYLDNSNDPPWLRPLFDAIYERTRDQAAPELKVIFPDWDDRILRRRVNELRDLLQSAAIADQQLDVLTIEYSKPGYQSDDDKRRRHTFVLRPNTDFR